MLYLFLNKKKLQKFSIMNFDDYDQYYYEALVIHCQCENNIMKFIKDTVVCVNTVYLPTVFWIKTLFTI